MREASTIVAALELGRKAHGFEIKKPFFKDAKEWVETTKQRISDIKEFGYSKTEINKTTPTLF